MPRGAIHLRTHVLMITADQGVQLEVLDWEVSGRPVVLRDGLGHTAHIYDGTAPS